MIVYMMSLVTLRQAQGDKDGMICNRLFGLTRFYENKAETQRHRALILFV